MLIKVALGNRKSQEVSILRTLGLPSPFKERIFIHVRKIIPQNYTEVSGRVEARIQLLTCNSKVINP